VTKSFSAWRQGARYYAPLLAVGSFAFLFGHALIGAPLLIAGACVLGFFRDPPRAIEAGPGEVVCPADGTIVSVERLETSPHYDGPCQRIAIFLSVLNVHVNRAPADGEITNIVYRPGLFLNALKDQSSEANESNAVWMQTPHGPMTVRQISGAIARRIVCIPEAGEHLAQGEKFGMIQFGSRTELFLALEAEILVTPRQKVNAGTTIVARF
jgi:phosphatidylserine decarboxylase